MILNIHFDGGSRGNPGPAAAGVVIEAADPPCVIHEAGYFFGRTTNNVAEYRGLIRGLELALDLRAKEVRLFSDSELLVKQIMGEYRVKSPDLKPLYEQATRHLLKLDLWQIRHVYREENRRADELANLAMDRQRDVVVTSGADFKQALASNPVAKLTPVDSSAASNSIDETSQRWTAVLERSPGAACPARCPAKRMFVFGPDTPQGFCIYATKAVLEDGPLEWSQTHDKHGEVTCDLCKVKIKIEKKM